jgi:hypothetical protein
MPTWALVLIISYKREREAWFAWGREKIERKAVAKNAETAIRATGGIIWYKLTPEALRAIISLSLDNRLNVIKTDNSAAMGMVRIKKDGRR